MRLILKRALSLALCLCLLLPSLALAEKDASGVRFQLNASMNPGAYPEADQATLRGIADLLAVMALSGTLETSFTGCMDLNADLVLDGAEETRTNIRIYGPRQSWAIQSNLLGDQTLTLNLGATLEFAMKAYFHLGIPLQYPSLLLSPYIHTNAFDSLLPLWQEVMQAQDGSRTIPRESIIAMAQRLAQTAADDRAFTYWVKAVALAAGYDDVLQSIMAELPEWTDSFLGEEGITVTAENGSETWCTNGMTLFSRVANGSLTTWTLTLPQTLEGYTFFAACTRKGGDVSLRLTIENTDDDELLLGANVVGTNLPLALPITEPFALSVHMTGETVPDDIALRFEGEGQDNAFTLRQVSDASGETMLTVSGMLTPYDPAVTPFFTWAEVIHTDLFSLNDTKLAELLHAISRPLADGMLPLLLHVPVSSFQSLLDLLTDSGILDLLTGKSEGMYEEETDSSWEEEESLDADYDYYASADGETAEDEGDEDYDYYASADGETAEDESDEE